ncbi:MAG TPA: hypothetical protein P5556_07385 [Candidatus Gastranaerophilales bacterium]|nr:hypothetical protein [Candidatus Gastranaerophilales bacterium]
MALNTNTNLSIAGQSNIFNSKTSGIVNENELTNVAKQILLAAPGKISSSQVSYTRPNLSTNIDVKFFEAGYDINAVKQAATNRTGYDVVLSTETLNSINLLKAHAAQNQALNIAKAVDGKIHINSEKPENADFKSLFMPGEPKNVEIFESSNLSKDRKGPGAFYIPLKGDKEEKKEGLNLVI